MFIGSQPHSFVYMLWLLLCCNGRVEKLQQKPPKIFTNQLFVEKVYQLLPYAEFTSLTLRDSLPSHSSWPFLLPLPPALVLKEAGFSQNQQIHGKCSAARLAHSTLLVLRNGKSAIKWPDSVIKDIHGGSVFCLHHLLLMWLWASYTSLASGAFCKIGIIIVSTSWGPCDSQN